MLVATSDCGFLVRDVRGRIWNTRMVITCRTRNEQKRPKMAIFPILVSSISIFGCSQFRFWIESNSLPKYTPPQYNRLRSMCRYRRLKLSRNGFVQINYSPMLCVTFAYEMKWLRSSACVILTDTYHIYCFSIKITASRQKCILNN